MNNNDTNSNNAIAGAIALFGILGALISFFKFDMELFKNGSHLYCLIDLIYIAACGITGYAILSKREDLVRIGAFIAVAGHCLKAFQILQWLISNYRYEGGAYAGMGWTIIYLLITIVGTVAFALLGALLTNKNVSQNQEQKKLVSVFLVISIVGDLIYPFRFWSSYYDKGEFITEWFSGNLTIISFMFLMIGFYIYLNADSPVYEVQSSARIPVTNVIAANKTASAGQVKRNEQPTNSMAEPKNDMRDIDFLRKYKELLDAEIITQDEFNEIKSKILGL